MDERVTFNSQYLVYNILKEHREREGCIFELIQTTVNQSFILMAEKKDIGGKILKKIKVRLLLI